MCLGTANWSAQIAGDVPRPAASLLKLPLGMAVEKAIAERPRGPLAAEEVPVAEVIGRWSDPTVLRALDPDRRLRVNEMLRLMVGSSDGPSAQWLLERVGMAAVAETIRGIGCEATSVHLAPGQAGGALAGRTTAADALLLLAAAADAQHFPMVARALAESTLNSRIPLGVLAEDVDIAHKTGTLRSVAHDVALLEVTGGRVWLAFLTDAQHDTLVSGYEMGLCTGELLAAFGLQATATRSVVGPP